MSGSCPLVPGGDECEVSIKDAAEAVAKAFDFKGQLVVSFLLINEFNGLTMFQLTTIHSAK